jgi:hypothetical protein
MMMGMSLAQEQKKQQYRQLPLLQQQINLLQPLLIFMLVLAVLP